MHGQIGSMVLRTSAFQWRAQARSRASEWAGALWPSCSTVLAAALILTNVVHLRKEAAGVVMRRRDAAQSYWGDRCEQASRWRCCLHSCLRSYTRLQSHRCTPPRRQNGKPRRRQIIGCVSGMDLITIHVPLVSQHGRGGRHD